jgi:hypothetical protein
VSREAQQWVAQLPLGACKSLAAFRVLDKLADAHHTDTDHAFRDVGKLAAELECSDRTVQRALRELERLQLILVGDQNVLPRTIRSNRAPTAYRLPWRKDWGQPELPGVTAGVTPAGAVDNSARGDRHAVPGVTTAVAHRTQEHLDKEHRPATDRARQLPLCTDGSTKHAVSVKGGQCIYCGRTRMELQQA